MILLDPVSRELAKLKLLPGEQLHKIFRSRDFSRDGGVKCVQGFQSLVLAQCRVGVLLGTCYACPRRAPESQGNPLPAETVARLVSDLATRLGHHRVDTVHIAYVIGLNNPDAVRLALEPFVQQHRSKFPAGTHRQRNLLTLARKLDLGTQAEALEEEIAATGFAIPKILAKLHEYLMSPFYPFGRLQLARFHKANLADAQKVASMGGFTAALATKFSNW